MLNLCLTVYFTQLMDIFACSFDEVKLIFSQKYSTSFMNENEYERIYESVRTKIVCSTYPSAVSGVKTAGTGPSSLKVLI